MPTKFLVIADLHARRSVLDRTLRIIEYAGEVSKERGCSATVFAGDIFHDRVTSHNKTFLTIRRALLNLPGSKYFLKGNHDCPDKAYDLTMLEALAEALDQTSEVITSPVVVSHENCQFAFLPYSESRINPDILDISEDSPSVLFGHCAVSGAVTGPEDYELISEYGISDFPEADLRIFGHYHKHQWLDDHSLYAGAPFPVTFGEANEDKGILYVEIPDKVGEQIKVELLPVPGIPRFYDFKVNSLEDLEEVKKVVDGNHVRVVSSIPIPEKTKSELRDRAESGGFSYLFAPPPASRDSYIPVEIEGFSLEAVTREYLSKQGYDERISSLTQEYFSNVLESAGLSMSAPGDLEPLWIRLKDFGPHVDTYLPLSEIGLTLLAGMNIPEQSEWPENIDFNDLGDSNAAGKSFILEGLLFCLDKTTLRGGKKNFAKLIRKGASDGEAQLAIRIRGKETIITRGIKDGLSITVDGVPQTDKDLDVWLKGFLSVGLETILQVMILGQKQRKLLYFLDNDEADQRRTLDTVLGMSILESWVKEAVKIAERAEETYASKQREIDSVRLPDVEYAVTREKQSSDNWEISRTSRYEAALREEGGRADVIKALKEAFDAATSALESKKGLLSAEKDKQAENLPKLEENFSAYEELCEWRQGLSTSIVQNQVEERNLTAKISKYKRLQGADTKECPECGQEVSEGHLEKEVSSLEMELFGVEATLSGLAGDIQEADSALAGLQEAQVALQEPDRQVASLEREVYSLELQAERARSRYESEKSASSAQAKAILDEVNPYLTRVSEAEEALAEAREAVEEMRTDLSLLDEHRYAAGALLESLGYKTGKGVRLHIYAAVQAHLNGLLEKYCTTLSNGRYILQLTLVEEDKKTKALKDKFGFKVILPSDTIDKDFASGGQNRRFNLAIMFAFRQLFQDICGIRCSLLCVDEVFDSMDDVGMEDVSKLLLELGKEIPSILAVSHSRALQQIFPSTKVCVCRGMRETVLRDL